jgi:hypothetical protein
MTGPLRPGGDGAPGPAAPGRPGPLTRLTPTKPFPRPRVRGRLRSTAAPAAHQHLEAAMSLEQIEVGERRRAATRARAGSDRTAP